MGLPTQIILPVRDAVGATPVCPTPGARWMRFYAGSQCVSSDAVVVVIVSGRSGVDVERSCDVVASTDRGYLIDVQLRRRLPSLLLAPRPQGPGNMTRPFRRRP